MRPFWLVIFRAGNVGQDGVIVILLHQTHRHSGNCALQFDTGIVERQACSAH